MNPDFLREIQRCPALDPALRDQFPMTKVLSHGKPFAYLNNAATTLKPEAVLDAMEHYYREYATSVHRGVDQVAHRATTAFEATRQKLASFVGSPHPDTIVFTRGTTDALNLVCQGYAEDRVGEGDEIVVTPNEHHANYVPWQQLCLRKGAKLVLAPLNKNGELTPEALESVMSERTRIVACTHITNVMGAYNDMARLAAVAHHYGAKLVADGAQGIAHERPEVEAWDIDFYAFSGHKIYGPTGVGALYGRRELLAEMRPVLYGGEMIDHVSTYESSFRDPPYRFEAGTPAVAEVIGLGAALDYINELGYCGMQKRVLQLTQQAIDGLMAQENVRVYNPENAFSGVVAFNIRGVHPHDASSVYDREGISLRAGHHCSQPTMNWLRVNATLRASFAFYNTESEVDRLVETSRKAGDFLDALF